MMFFRFVIFTLLLITAYSAWSSPPLPPLSVEEQVAIDLMQPIVFWRELQQVDVPNVSDEILLRLGHSFRDGIDGVQQSYPNAEVLYQAVLDRAGACAVLAQEAQTVLKAQKAQEALWEAEDRQLVGFPLNSVADRVHLARAYSRGEGRPRNIPRARYHDRIALKMDPKNIGALVELGRIAIEEDGYGGWAGARPWLTRLAPLVDPDEHTDYLGLKNLVGQEDPDFASTLDWGGEVRQTAGCTLL